MDSLHCGKSATREWFVICVFVGGRLSPEGKQRRDDSRWPVLDLDLDWMLSSPPLRFFLLFSSFYIPHLPLNRNAHSETLMVSVLALPSLHQDVAWQLTPGTRRPNGPGLSCSPHLRSRDESAKLRLSPQTLALREMLTALGFEAAKGETQRVAAREHCHTPMPSSVRPPYRHAVDAAISQFLHTLLRGQKLNEREATDESTIFTNSLSTQKGFFVVSLDL